MCSCVKRLSCISQPVNLYLVSGERAEQCSHILSNSLSSETVALIFVAITLIRGQHTDGAVSQTHRLRIKMASLATLVMACGREYTPSKKKHITTFFQPSF